MYKERPWAISILCSNSKYEQMLNEEGWYKSYEGIMVPVDGLKNEFYNQIIERELMETVSFNPSNIDDIDNQDVIEIEKCLRKMRHANMWRGAIKELNKKKAEKPNIFSNHIQFSKDCCKLIEQAKIGNVQRSFVYELFLESVPLEIIQKDLSETSSNFISFEIDQTECEE